MRLKQKNKDSSLIGKSVLAAVWPEKNWQITIKVAKNDFTRKMIDFEAFTKIA